ncbi:hypothetical protein BGZ96_005668 [Linnemannia gamsii]|uniref:Up-regulated during septation protein 1 domain-containing protein n=1 Tax=Linnemannia gamsii TaxID=64522 RepID=A0ABQ7K669_9FUNG|nr:hypothetical protein BGZ96_005668 [Linnemannia gamsii]
MAPKSITSSTSNNNPPSTSSFSSDTTNTTNNKNTTTSSSGSSGASSFHSRHGSTISILSVPLLDPFYRDLVALKTDHTALYAELKRTQQTLQLSYQDLVMAQERSKRAETDSGRLKSHMEAILKKHVDHHPERETLVQQLAELQTSLNIELGARRVLEQEHSLLQHELIRYRLSNSSNTNNNNIRTPSSSTTNSAAAQSNNASNNLLPPSPVGSIRAAAFSLFSGGNSRKSARSSIDTGTGSGSSNSSSGSRYNNNNNNGRTPSTWSVRMTDEIQSMQESSPAPPPPPNTPLHFNLLSAPSTPRTNSNFTTSVSTPPPPPTTPAQQLRYEGGVTVIQDLDHENISAIQSRLPSLEELEGQKLFFDKLAEENVAMKMEIQDLRYRNKAEKDSIKGYMSLFESLQKKQSNALAVAQAEIDLLRSTIQEQLLRLESRETLIQTFAATVNSQAIELEILTRDASRERTARAKIEQEMALLIEASLLMLERLFANVDQTVRSGLVRMLDPIRQTIHHLEIPSILQEWDLCEQGVQRIVNDLARSLVLQQEVQEKGLEGNGGGGGDGAGSLSSGSTGPLVKVDNSSSNSSNNGNRNPRNSISSIHSAMSTHSTTSNTKNNNTVRSHQLQEYPEESMMILNNNFSQQVFVWRKFTADTFLEECVKSVEDLAQERRELQTRIVELTRVIVEQDEARRLKEIADSREGGVEEEQKKKEEDAMESVIKVQKEEKPVAEEEREEEPVEKWNEGTTVEVKETSDVDDRKAKSEATDPTAQINLSPDTQFKDSLESAKESTTTTVPLSSSSYTVGRDSGAYQENCSMFQQESPPPLNTIDHRNRRRNTAAEAAEEESHERTRRLELILQKVLEWSGDRLETSKDKKPAPPTATTATSDKLDSSEEKNLEDDNILSLGISDAPPTVMRADVRLAEDATLSSSTMNNSVLIRNSDVSRPSKGDLETLFQLIRQELTKTASVALSTEASLQKENAVDESFTSTVAPPLISVEAEDVVAVTGDPEEPVTAELLHVESPTTEPAVIAAAALTAIVTDTSSDTFANEASCATNVSNNTSGGNTRSQTRPEGITTSSLSLARRTSSSSSVTSTPTTSSASASSTSSSSTTSSSSSYFFSSTVQLGSLSTPSSPGLGGIGGPDGQTLLDVEALSSMV